MSTSVLILCSLLIFRVVCEQARGKKSANEQYPYDYCDMVCDDKVKFEHTMCQFPAGGGEKCNNNLKVYLTQEEKVYIADNLNRIRLLVAQGNTEGFPQAANMMKLVWDSELSTIAKRWADQCTQPKHDKCRITSDETKTGQNTFIDTYRTTAKGPEQRLTRIKAILDKWEAEKAEFNLEWLKSYNSSTQETSGDFSQIIWATTDSLGCGYTEFQMESKVMTRFVCNFKRRGNVDNRTVYRPGTPCSGCPVGSKCGVALYHGLCSSGKKPTYRDAEEEDSGGHRLELTVELIMVAWTMLVLYSQPGGL